MHYEESSQATKWQLSSQLELNSLRERANRRARDILSHETNGSSLDGGDGGSSSGGGGLSGGANGGSAGDANGVDNNGNGDHTQSPMAGKPLEVFGFAATRGERPKIVEDGIDEEGTENVELMSPSDPNYGPTHSSDSRGHYPFVTPSDESLLVTFYCSKIPLLIGPHATLARCRRDAKVAATACLLFRRYYLSNSVMMHDPKCMLVAAAFLASKVEDAMLDVRYLEMGTKEMNAPVTMMEILDAEVKFLKGIDFDLLVFHPYKTVLSYTEDLRTYLKSDKGRSLVVCVGGGEGEQSRQVAGEDLRPMHDAAMKIVDDVIVSDIPLLYGPGEVGLAALMVANEELSANIGENGTVSEGGLPPPPQIDFMGYLRSRFQESNESEFKVDASAMDAVILRVSKVCRLLQELKEGKHGCGNHKVDMESLKGVHKKLKKCRAWGPLEKDKKKKKKRKAEGSAEEDGG